MYKNQFSFDQNLYSSSASKRLLKEIKEIKDTSYLFVGGGVASGIGKGITISSIATCLQRSGYLVTVIKIDPYLNIDAGTMSPWEHGEVFILHDGAEVDLDLGNYERYLDQNFSSDNNITSGKVYNEVITKERNGDYKGKTVQFVPHVSRHIIEMIYKVGNTEIPGKGRKPQIVLVELGGTVGDYESIVFYEAVRQIMLEQEKCRTFFLLVSYVPFFTTTGEQKTKPTQNALNALRMTGIRLDFLVLRSHKPLDDSQINKIAMFANLKTQQVLNIPDLESVHQVPLLFSESMFPYKIMLHFQYYIGISDIKIYRDLQQYLNIVKSKPHIDIAVVGKYVGIEDSYLSLKKAIQSAAIAADIPVNVYWVNSEYLEDAHKKKNKVEYDEAWKDLKRVKGIIIPGGYDIRGLQGKIDCAKYAREHKVPMLGICYGFQVMCIEYARNVMGIKNATTYEVAIFRDTKKTVEVRKGKNQEQNNQPEKLNEKKEEEEILIEEMQEVMEGKQTKRSKSAKGKASQKKSTQKEKVSRKTSLQSDIYGDQEVYVIEDMPDASLTVLGGTMRKGAKLTKITSRQSLAYKMYSKDEIYERYRHRFEVSLNWIEKFKKAGINFSGVDETGLRMEILELDTKKHPFYFGVQFHPEFLSRNFKPSPPFLALLKASNHTLEQDFKENDCLTYNFSWTKHYSEIE